MKLLFTCMVWYTRVLTCHSTQYRSFRRRGDVFV